MGNNKVVRCENWDQVEAAIAELNAAGSRCYVETKKVGNELHLIALTSTSFSAGIEVHIPMTLVAGENSEKLNPKAVAAARQEIERLPDLDLYGKLSVEGEKEAETVMAGNESLLLDYYTD